MSNETSGQDFWSRRKAAVKKEEDQLEADRIKAETDEAVAELEEKSDEEILEELGLPEPEELKEGDDFSAFMKAAIPDRIRRRALRQLWLTNPALANLDGLIEYGEDFTDASTVVENLQTAYQVGKGMLKHVEKMAEEAEAKLKEEEAEEVADGSESSSAEMAESDAGGQSRSLEEADSVATEISDPSTAEMKGGETGSRTLTSPLKSADMLVDDEATDTNVPQETVEADLSSEKPRRRMRFTFG